MQARVILFANRYSYSVALLDITPGRPFRFATHQADQRFSPGSVGKLAIAAGLFAELQRLYPDSTADRQAFLGDVLAGAALGYFLSAFIHDAFIGLSASRRFRLIIWPSKSETMVSIAFSF